MCCITDQTENQCWPHSFPGVITAVSLKMSRLSISAAQNIFLALDSPPAGHPVLSNKALGTHKWVLARDEEPDRGQAMAGGQVHRAARIAKTLSRLRSKDSRIRISSACFRCLPGLWETHQSGAEGGRKVERHIIYWVQARWEGSGTLLMINQ